MYAFCLASEIEALPELLPKVFLDGDEEPSDGAKILPRSPSVATKLVQTVCFFFKQKKIKIIWTLNACRTTLLCTPYYVLLYNVHNKLISNTNHTIKHIFRSYFIL